MLKQHTQTYRDLKDATAATHEKYAAYKEALDENKNSENPPHSIAEMDNLKQQFLEQYKLFDDAKGKYQEVESQLADNTTKIVGWHELQAIAISGTAEEIKKANEDQGASYMNSTALTYDELVKQQKQHQEYYETIKELHDNGSQLVTEDDVEAARKMAEKLGTALAESADNQKPNVAESFDGMMQGGKDSIYESGDEFDALANELLERTSVSFGEASDTKKTDIRNHMRDLSLSGAEGFESEMSRYETLGEMPISTLDDSQIEAINSKKDEMSQRFRDLNAGNIDALEEALPQFRETGTQPVYALEEGQIATLSTENPIMAASMSDLAKNQLDSYNAQQPLFGAAGSGGVNTLKDEVVTTCAIHNPFMQKNFEALAKDGVNGYSSVIPQMGLAGSSAISTLSNSIINEAVQKSSSVHQSGQDISHELASGVQSQEADAANKGLNMVRKAVNVLQSAVYSSNTYSMGRFLGMGINDGLSSTLGTIISTAQRLIYQAMAAARRAAGIHSPSTKMRDLVGKPLGQGLEVGMETTLPLIEREMSEEVSSLVARMRGTVQAETSALSARVSAASLQTSAVTAADTQQTAGGRRPLQLHLYEDGQEMAVKLMPYIEKLGGYRACLP